MLWYKSWLDTRWRFLLGLALLLVAACGAVVAFSTVQELAALLPTVPVPESFRDEVEESLELLRTFRGYAWSEWFAGNLPMLLTFLAALLGSGSPLAKSGSGVLFSLALPVSRRLWIGTRAVTGLAQLLVLALAGSVAIAASAPLVGEQFPVVDAFVYALCAFTMASLFFAAAAFLSTLFNDVWRPLLLTCIVAIAIALAGSLLSETRGLFQAMAGRTYFYGGALPWAELLLGAAGTAALIYTAAASIARRDF